MQTQAQACEPKVMGDLAVLPRRACCWKPGRAAAP